MIVNIEKESVGRKIIVCLSGRLRSEHFDGLKLQTEGNTSAVALDLDGVTWVDVEVIRFLTGCEQSGVELLHCLPYIREWILRDKNEKYRGSDTIHGKREKANHDYCLQGCSAAEPRAN
jgi:hypothetical protein